MTNITLFDAFVLLASIPSERSILSYSSIYDSYKHSSKNLVDSIYHLLQKKIMKLQYFI